MKKQIVLALIAGTLLTMAGTSQAGNSRYSHNNYYSGGYSGGHHGYQSGYGRNNYYSGGHQGYRSGYSNHNYRQSRHHGRGHNDFGRGLAIVAGAAIVGSVIHSIGHSSRYRNDYRTSSSYYPQQDYWYRQDSRGECFEVIQSRQGRETWTYVDSSYCY